MKSTDEKNTIKYLLFYACILLIIDTFFSFISSLTSQDIVVFPFIQFNSIKLGTFLLDLPMRFIFNFGIVSLVYFILQYNDIDLNERFIQFVNDLRQKINKVKENQQSKGTHSQVVNDKVKKQEKKKPKKKEPNLIALSALIILLLVMISMRLYYGTLFIFEQFTNERFVLLISPSDLVWVSDVIIISVAISTVIYMIKFVFRTVLLDVIKSVIDLVIIILIATHDYQFNQEIIDEYPALSHASEVLNGIFLVIIIITIVELIANIVRFMIELIQLSDSDE